jgi:hypothetical protein
LLYESNGVCGVNHRLIVDEIDRQLSAGDGAPKIPVVNPKGYAAIARRYEPLTALAAGLDDRHEKNPEVRTSLRLMHAQAVVLFGGERRNGLDVAHPCEQVAEPDDAPSISVAMMRQSAGNHRTMDFVVSFARDAGGGAHA